ncbi:MAG: hypothetical protein V4730_11975 [Pseudomonadota bacterium]
MVYEFDDLDLELITKLRDAFVQYDNGDPLKDFVDEDDLVQAVELLFAIIDAEKETQ